MQTRYMDGLTTLFGNISVLCNGLQRGSVRDDLRTLFTHIANHRISGDHNRKLNKGRQALMVALCALHRSVGLSDTVDLETDGTILLLTSLAYLSDASRRSLLILH
jgi:hypothetical protein